MLLGLVLLACLTLLAGGIAVVERRRTQRLGAELATVRARAEQEERDRQARESELAEAQAELAAVREHLEVSEQRAAAAERHAQELHAARRLAEARAAVGARGLLEALWRLEQIRASREWREAAGPVMGVPGPARVTAAGLVEAALATVRELVGTPSRVDAAWPPEELATADPSGSGLVLARLCDEAIRLLARQAEELVLEVPGPGLVVLVAVPSPGAGRPEVADLEAAAQAAGARVRLVEENDLIRLELEEPARSAWVPVED